MKLSIIGHVLFVSVWFISSDIRTVPQTPPAFHFHFAEAPGKYAAGLHIVEQYDRTRVFHSADGGGGSTSSDGPRPLQTLIWYPAEQSTQSTMTLGDYAALIKTETSCDQPTEHGKSQAFVTAFVHGRTALPTRAIRDATMQPGRFPLVIYAPSINAPSFENIELCEYLASHGFVVIAAPSMGAASRTMTVDLAGANAEAQDISFELNYAGTLPDVDTSEMAVAGYSWGGMAGLFAAARDKRVTALISLDGSFRYSPATVQQAGDVKPDQMRIPLLVFSRAEEPLETWEAQHPFNAAPSVLNQWTRGDLCHAHMLAMSHIQFSSLYQRSERFQREGLQFSPADYSLDEGAQSYDWVARYCLEFLGAYLKRDREAMLFLQHTPAENGVPRHLMAASCRFASNMPAVSR